MSNRPNRPKPSMRAVAAEHDARVKQAAERRRRNLILGSVGALVLLVAVVVAVVVITSSESSPAAMSPVAVDAGCASCHSVDGRRSQGPTFEGLAGSEVPLQDGTVVVADTAYIRRAIEDPAAQARQGFSPMPEQQLTPEQVDELVRYIETLG